MLTLRPWNRGMFGRCKGHEEPTQIDLTMTRAGWHASGVLLEAQQSLESAYLRKLSCAQSSFQGLVERSIGPSASHLQYSSWTSPHQHSSRALNTRLRNTSAAADRLSRGCVQH